MSSKNVVRFVVYMIEELQWALNFDTGDNDEKTKKKKKEEVEEVNEEMSEVLEWMDDCLMLLVNN